VVCGTVLLLCAGLLSQQAASAKLATLKESRSACKTTGSAFNALYCVNSSLNTTCAPLDIYHMHDAAQSGKQHNAADLALPMTVTSNISALLSCSAAKPLTSWLQQKPAAVQRLQQPNAACSR
jgi:hypothetical protein